MSKTAAFQRFLQNILKNDLPPDYLSLLPRGWQKYGHIALLNLHKNLMPYKGIIAKQSLPFFKKLNFQSVAIRGGPTKELLRVPQIELLAGHPNPIVLHKENHCIYRFDITKITFSNGNHYERKRLINKIGYKSTVIDLFACVGNLSLGLAVHKKTRIIGIELNPLAYSYLCHNLILNRVSNIYTPILGDNRLVTPKRLADHVLLGYWGIDQKQCLVALRALKKTGGWLYFHELVQEKTQLNAKYQIERIIQEHGLSFKVDISQSRRVKWVAPKLGHWTTDIQIRAN
ncbi:MAG: class I SAM-dependent methyltransferase family protein [Promethearchaeota archaeon]